MIITKVKKEKQLCECGSMVSSFEKSRHLKSQKHQAYLKQQEENQFNILTIIYLIIIIMVLTLNNTNTLKADNIVVSGTNLSDLYATINYVDTNSGGVSQTDFDTSIASLQSKDIAYNNTLLSHISLIDTNTTDIATHTNDITVLNTKQIHNFAGITDINTNLTNNYQTTTQLNSNFVSPTTLTTNHYTKTEIDTTLGNYYTSLQIDAGFYSQT